MLFKSYNERASLLIGVISIIFHARPRTSTNIRLSSIKFYIKKTRKILANLHLLPISKMSAENKSYGFDLISND